MTNAAGLHANAYLSLTRRSDGPLYEVKSPGFGYFDRPIRFSHFRLLSIRTNPKTQAKGHSQMPETIGHLSGTNPEISEFAVEGGWESERTSATYLRSDQILSGGLR